MSRLAQGKTSAPKRRELGRYIRRLRQERGFTQVEATARMGRRRVWHTTWSQIEAGKMAKPETVVRMAIALDALYEQTREMFHLAGHGELFDYIAEAGRFLHLEDNIPLRVAIQETEELDGEGKAVLTAVLEGELAKRHARTRVRHVAST